MQELIITSKEDLQTLIQTLLHQEFEHFRKEAKPARQTPEREFLTVGQASEFLNLKVPTLYGYVSKRKIPYIKSPGAKKILFEKSTLVAWLDNGTRHANNPTT